MQIHFTGRNLEVTPSLKTFTEEKVTRLVKRNQKITNIYFTFDVDKKMHHAEAHFHVNGMDIHAVASAEDMHTAIDKLIDRLIVQLTKIKEKSKDHREE
ncbi:MAG: ribosome-associated translation inhibitor RaiA [Gammaproteobacteria bacterium]|nr:ribosome-associated translation inhibitor RaiA [Gammaproteobacteria bacterium]